MKVLAFFSAILLISACFFPWVIIESKGITVSGINATGTNFGKPGFFHFVFVGLGLFLLLVNRSWSQKGAVVFAAFNLAWSLRNYIVISGCRMGDCPAKQPAIYFLIPASILFLLGTLLWDHKAAKKGD